MDLWTEFEGHTIDSAFALNKLLQTEGRSAFFSTLNEKGESVLIRIVECHFDEDEILARWRGVQVLNHPNFLRIDRYGQFLIEADDITAVYVVFERVDANLAQVLEKGRLSAGDAAEIARSMVSTLQTLHENGFVHEHVEAGNIFAVGETVKMRSDCVRETPEGQRGFEARRRDVVDLALVLTQVLTGSKSPFALHGRTPLPAPFDEIVQKATSGEWGLAEIAAALPPLHRAKPAPSQRAVATPAAAPAAASATGPAVSAVAAKPLSDPPQTVTTAGTAKLHEVPAKPISSRSEQRALPFDEAAHRSRLNHFEDNRLRSRGSLLIEEWMHRFQEWPMRWIAAIAMFLVVVLCGWGLMHHLIKARAASVATAAPATAAAHSPARPGQSALRPRQVSTPASVPAVAHGTTARGTTQWRVVAFTYNHQADAQKKAASLAQKLPGLQPQAFRPSGRGPWLVTVGGPLERNAAYALAHRARSLGLPHDTYAQNYTVR